MPDPASGAHVEDSRHSRASVKRSRSRVERLMPWTAMAAAPMRAKRMLRDFKIPATGARRLSRSAPRDIGIAAVPPVDGARTIAPPPGGRAADPGRRRTVQGRGRRAQAPGRPAPQVSGARAPRGSPPAGDRRRCAWRDYTGGAASKGSRAAMDWFVVLDCAVTNLGKDAIEVRVDVV